MESEKTIYKKNDMVTVEITDMDEKGQGIGKAEGFTLFVKDAVIGDVCFCKTYESGKAFTRPCTGRMSDGESMRRMSVTGDELRSGASF